MCSCWRRSHCHFIQSNSLLYKFTLKTITLSKPISRTKKYMLEQTCTFYRFFHIQTTRLTELSPDSPRQSLTFRSTRMDLKLQLVQDTLLCFILIEHNDLTDMTFLGVRIRKEKVFSAENQRSLNTQRDGEEGTASVYVVWI